ncbi:TetR/AcrR family transcriptional regulator [Pigmentiphaga sp. GD03639]|uniref:TetR/AcrR family transcriptional regulator n=1 Tax=unclassified Pigmentiphaga TaxID=2626614 RepID=UPI001A9D0766|nr:MULTISPECIES: TetR/AcrR family transcriptional regulator [unclassified Pigmentiphaga]MDH2236542.1 TetR/AcrR family transcriptional regulator [Pigmentiphaga sp. GD03639]
MTMPDSPRAESRSERKRRQNREALIEAGYQLIADKGIDAATMSEIAEMADVSAGTVYYYFDSKDELAMAVMERVMERLAWRISVATKGFDDPASVYAFGVRSTIQIATTDQRWNWLLRRSEVIADAMFRVLGPHATRDLRLAAAAGRFHFEDAELVYRLTTDAIVGICRAICDNQLSSASIDEAVILLLGMAGMPRAEAKKIFRKKWPKLPED